MKKIILKAALAFVSASFLMSCGEEEFLAETPKSFLSPENAYVTTADFNMALNGIYSRCRANYYDTKDNNCFELWNCTDVAKNARANTNWMGAPVTFYTPQQAVINNVWEREYKLISWSNVLVDRLAGASIPDSDKQVLNAEGRFFRAFGYRALVYLFGGVPLILEETTGPKYDYVRASKEEVLEAMKEDFKVASENLPDISKVDDGRISKEVAKFFYAETLMSLGDYKTAITVLTEVINNPALALMNTRFGSLKSEEGDVFYDLFRVGNQNRGSGNTEALWVAQMETDVIGGMLVSTAYRPFYLERMAAPVTYSLTGPNGETKAMLDEKNGLSTLNCGGRGVANMTNTLWWLNDLWESDFDNDMRNSKYNIVRDAFYDNPSSEYYGMSAIYGETKSKKLVTDPWRWYPWPSKITTPGQHPDALYQDKATLRLKSVAGGTYRDAYFLRLPEVYLLRAEAYMKDNNNSSAAADINVVRARANAKPVAAADVTIDYILDERARELVYEEFRRLTLGRLGMYVERMRKYNDYEGPQIKDYMELWPIPYAAIEANKDAVMEQNPGYTN